MSLQVRDYSALCPLLLVQDVDVAVDFYEHVLQFVALAKAKDDGGVTIHAEAIFSPGRVVAHQPQGPFLLQLARADAYNSADKSWLRNAVAGPRGRGMVGYVYVDDVEAFHDAVLAAGGRPCMPLSGTEWGDRVFAIDDPDGYRWTFATNTQPFAA